MRISLRILALAAAALAGYGAGRWHGRVGNPAPAAHDEPDPARGQTSPELRALVEKAAEQALPLPTLPATSPAPDP